MTINDCKDIVATGNIPGSDITVNVNSNGTVDTVVNTISENSIFNRTWTECISTVYDPINNKVIIAYNKNDVELFGIAIVGTIHDNTILFGSPVIFNNADTLYISLTYDTNSNKVVIAYNDGNNNGYGTAIVGTVSDDTILFGTPVVFNNDFTNNISAIYNTLNNKVVIAYTRNTNDYFGAAIVGTVVDNSITFGLPVIFNSNNTYEISAVYDTANNKVVIAYYNTNHDGYGTAIVGTVVDNSILFGSPVIFNIAGINCVSTVYDPVNNKVVIAYTDNGNNGYGTAIVGTVIDDTILFGIPVVFNNANTPYMSTIYDTVNNKIIIAYYNSSNNSYGAAIVGTVTDTTISFESPTVFNNTVTYYTSVVYNSIDNKVVIAYNNCNNRGFGTAIVYDPHTIISNI